LLSVLCYLLALFARVTAELPDSPPLRLGQKITRNGGKVTICVSFVKKEVKFGAASNTNKNLVTLQQASEIEEHHFKLVAQF